jgi:hypothetical protein
MVRRTLLGHFSHMISNNNKRHSHIFLALMRKLSDVVIVFLSLEDIIVLVVM